MLMLKLRNRWSISDGKNTSSYLCGGDEVLEAMRCCTTSFHVQVSEEVQHSRRLFLERCVDGWVMGGGRGGVTAENRLWHLWRLGDREEVLHMYLRGAVVQGGGAMDEEAGALLAEVYTTSFCVQSIDVQVSDVGMAVEIITNALRSRFCGLIGSLEGEALYGPVLCGMDSEALLWVRDACTRQDTDFSVTGDHLQATSQLIEKCSERLRQGGGEGGRAVMLKALGGVCRSLFQVRKLRAGQKKR